MFLITGMRRKRLQEQPFPPAWQTIMEQVPLCRRLPGQDRAKLQGSIQVFLGEKYFEGQGGIVITDRIRVTIAAQACILILNRPTDFYPGLSSIIVYPGEYCAPRADTDEWGIVTEGIDYRTGESTRDGALVLSWEDVLAEELDVHDGYNVVLHEFAHQLDEEEGVTGGMPLLPKRSRLAPLKEALLQEFQRLREDLAKGLDTVLDPYGEESPEEFFAVATEAFFETPLAVRTRHPELYDELTRFYRQDPAEWRED